MWPGRPAGRWPAQPHGAFAQKRAPPSWSSGSAQEAAGSARSEPRAGPPCDCRSQERNFRSRELHFSREKRWAWAWKLAHDQLHDPGPHSLICKVCHLEFWGPSLKISLVPSLNDLPSDWPSLTRAVRGYSSAQGRSGAAVSSHWAENRSSQSCFHYSCFPHYPPAPAPRRKIKLSLNSINYFKYNLISA